MNAVPSDPNREGQNRSWSYPNYRHFRDRATLLDVVAQDDQAVSIAADGSARTWGALPITSVGVSRDRYASVRS